MKLFVFLLLPVQFVRLGRMELAAVGYVTFPNQVRTSLLGAEPRHSKMEDICCKGRGGG